MQGCREGTSSIAFELQIKNCEIDSINLSIFNYLALNINLFIFNCLTSNFCFLKIYISQERTTVYGRASAVSDFFFETQIDFISQNLRKIEYCILRYQPLNNTQAQTPLRFQLFRHREGSSLRLR